MLENKIFFSKNNFLLVHSWKLEEHVIKGMQAYFVGFLAFSDEMKFYDIFLIPFIIIKRDESDILSRHIL